MLIAQALAEYGALSAVAEAFHYAYLQAQTAFDLWGAQALLVLVGVGVLWRLVISFK